MSDRGTPPARRPLARLWAVLVLVVVTGSLYSNLPRLLGRPALYPWVPPFRESYNGNMIDHLGGEYRQIALALAAGDGYANPFGEPTGPTAWMPPVVPLLQAALFVACGGVARAAVCVALLQDLAVILAGCVVIDAARHTSNTLKGPAIALGIYTIGVFYHFHSCFQRTHDSWLVLIWISLIYLAASRLWGRPSSARTAMLWGAFGGIAALTGPVLGLVWSAVTLGLAFSIGRTKPLVLSLLAAILVVSPWVCRNYLVFDRFIPIKSNLYFELYQSSVLEPDGVLRDVTSLSHHPYLVRGPERRSYRRMGEMAYLDGYRSRFVDYLRRAPADFLSKVGHRLLAATLVYYPHYDWEGGITLLASYVIHPLPFYGLILMLLLEAPRLDTRKRLAILIYSAYLIPYVLVAYYERYGFPLLGMKTLFCFWGFGAAYRRLTGAPHCRSTPAPTEVRRQSS